MTRFVKHGDPAARPFKLRIVMFRRIRESLPNKPYVCRTSRGNSNFANFTRDREENSNGRDNRNINSSSIKFSGNGKLMEGPTIREPFVIYSHRLIAAHVLEYWHACSCFW